MIGSWLKWCGGRPAPGPLAALLLALTAAACAEPVEWTGQAGNDWFQPGNWSPARVPRAGDSVVAAAAGTIALTNATPRLASLDLQAGTVVVSGWNSALRADTVVIAGTITHADNLTDAPDAAGAWVPQHRVLLEGSNISIAAGGIVDADFKGYRRG